MAISAVGGILLLWKPGNLAVFVAANLLYTFGVCALLTFLSSMYSQHIRRRRGFFIALMRSSTALVRVAGNLVAAQVTPRCLEH